MFKTCHNAKILHVIGEAQGEALVVMQTCLKHTDPSVLNPILEERFEVQDLQKHLLPGKVVLQGKLVKNIIFKAVRASSSPVEHQQVVEPFEVDIPLPGLRPGIRVANQLIFPANPMEDIHLQVHILGIHSDTSLKTGWCEEGQNHDDECSRDVRVVFHDSALATHYNSKYKHHGKKHKHHDENHQSSGLIVKEKVIIKFSIVAAQFRLTRIPVCKPPQVFHCTCQEGRQKFAPNC